MLIELKQTFYWTGPLARFSLRVAMFVFLCLFMYVCTTFSFSLNILLLFTKVKSPINRLQKKIPKEEFRKDIGLRFSNLFRNGWKMHQIYFFWSLALICNDARQNFNGRMTELAWMHNGICIDARRNLHGRTTELPLTNNNICLDTKFLAFDSKYVKCIFLTDPV